MTAQNPEARRNSFRVAEFFTCSIRPERSDAHRDSFEANGVLCTKTGQIRQATALYYTNPRFGEVQHYVVLASCVNASPFREHEKLAAFAVGDKPFAKLYRFFKRHAFREGAHLRAMEAIDSQDFSRKW
jgi:hypothetical protein